MEESKDSDDLSVDIKIIKETIHNQKELFDEKLKSYRNYALIILAMLSLWGYTTISSTIKNTIKRTAEKKLMR